MNSFNINQRGVSRRQFGPCRRGSTKTRQSRRFAVKPGLEFLETRITPAGSISVTKVVLLDWQNNQLSASSPVGAGQPVDVMVYYQTEDLPPGASYSIKFTVDGHSKSLDDITAGAGAKKSTPSYFDTDWVAALGKNEVTVTVDPNGTVRGITTTKNTASLSFNAGLPAVANNLPFTVAQIRDAYGINSIASFGSKAADGAGQTIAIVDAFNDPTVFTDLESFDQAMYAKTTSTQTLAAQYGTASSFLNVYNQNGANISLDVGKTGQDGVPGLDPSGSFEGEEAEDVEWAHAIAPAAKIDLIETNTFTSILTGVTEATKLSGVTVVSMSWSIGAEWSDEQADDSLFTTPSGHAGITFLAIAGDSGADPGTFVIYPSASPNVVSVGATQLSMNDETYAGETGWDFPAPRVLQANSTASSPPTWTTTVTAADLGWSKNVEVSATWVPSARNATYDIYDTTTGTVLGKVPVNQAEAPVGIAATNPYDSNDSQQFQDLGVYHVSNGDSLKVVLDASGATGTIAAGYVGIAPAWAGGGGQSKYELEPSYQSTVESSGFRMTPDVSFVGSDMSTVVMVQGGQFVFGGDGTSLATPCWAGLIAIANQGRIAAGGTTLNTSSTSKPNPTQTLQALYDLPPSDFHDITSGYNGFSAEPGYDEVTGRGSPIASLVVAGLVDYDLVATKLVITSEPPHSVAAGNSFRIVVSMEDPFGHVITSDDASVTIALGANPVDGPLDGLKTMKAHDGVASFSSLSLTKVGNGYTLEATSGSLIAGKSSAINVTPAAAYQLVVTTEPPSTVDTGKSFGLTVTAEDRFGNVATSYNGIVSLQAQTFQPTGGTLPGERPTLGGTVTMSASNGVAIFSGLLLNNAGFDDTIEAIAANLLAAETTTIAVKTTDRNPRPALALLPDGE